MLSNNILINAADGEDNIGIHLTHEQSENNLRFGNIQINNNIIRDTTAHGIKVDRYYGVNIIGNTIKNACSGNGVSDAIHVRLSSAGQILNNFIYSDQDVSGNACRENVRITN